MVFWAAVFGAMTGMGLIRLVGGHTDTVTLVYLLVGVVAVGCIFRAEYR